MKILAFPASKGEQLQKKQANTNSQGFSKHSSGSEPSKSTNPWGFSKGAANPWMPANASGRNPFSGNDVAQAVQTKKSGQQVVEGKSADSKDADFCLEPQGLNEVQKQGVAQPVRPSLAQGQPIQQKCAACQDEEKMQAKFDPANSASARVIQRTLEVESPNTRLPGNPPRENWEDIRDYLQVMSPSFAVNSSGVVSPVVGLCNAASRTTDQCLCDLHNSPHAWKILIDDSDWPHTEKANHRVTVHSSRSIMEFGAWGGGAQAGTRVILPNARVLAHELCGHAWLMEQGTHPHMTANTVGGRVERHGHDDTVRVENQTATEMYGPQAPVRGVASDPHRGESFAKVSVSGFPSNAAQVSTLSPEMQARLARILSEMNSQPTLFADIMGHSDQTGSDASKRSIGLNRAQQVRRYLMSGGISGRRILETKSKSDTECPAVPVGANPDCRKVEIFLFNYHGASERYP